ncbi:hypothetical protein INR49_009853 [Caranx melampygus]|nr:hypothetical protein INR49_009853 [Caranx melampygus]
MIEGANHLVLPAFPWSQVHFILRDNGGLVPSSVVWHYQLRTLSAPASDTLDGMRCDSVLPGLTVSVQPVSSCRDSGAHRPSVPDQQIQGSVPRAGNEGAGAIRATASHFLGFGRHGPVGRRTGLDVTPVQGNGNNTPRYVFQEPRLNMADRAMLKKKT